MVFRREEEAEAARRGGRGMKHLVQRFAVFLAFPLKHHPNVMTETLGSGLPVTSTGFTFYTLPRSAINLLVFLMVSSL